MFEDISHEVVVASAGKRSIQLFVHFFMKSIITVTDNNDIVVIQLTSTKERGASHLHVTVEVSVFSLVHFFEQSLQAYVRRLKISFEYSVATRECNYLISKIESC